MSMKLFTLAMVIVASATVLTTVHAAFAAQDSQDSKSSGKVAFDRVCKVCHGAEGSGDNAPRLVPFEREYDEVLGIVRDGQGEMPAISERRVTDAEVKQIVEYLHSLSKTDEHKQ
jgi:mono/diheme cytochrome c family protein